MATNGETRVLVISAETDSVRVDTMPRKSLEYLQGKVGGWVQCVDFPAYDMWMHEEGKIIGLPQNKIATALWRQTYGDTDIIVGDVVLTGPPDHEGYSTDLPQHVLDATASLSYIVQMMPRVFDYTLDVY